MSYFDRWKGDFELKYTQRQLDKIIEDTIKSCTVNRILQRTKYGDNAMMILSIHRMPDGVIVYVQ